MLVVSNTSPITNLALIHRMDLLRDQFGRVLVPDAVRTELERIPNSTANTSIEGARREGWIELRLVQNQEMAGVLASQLDRGEAETIALAIQEKADLLLIDEREGRVVARQAGLRVRGVLGILLRAKSTGKISSVRAEIEALRRDARFFVAPALEEEILRAAGE